MNKKSQIIYLDNNATTSLSENASAVIMDLVIHDIYGNSSSIHSKGVKTRALIESSRSSVAKSLGCFPNEIVFTSGGTESNNLAIRGVCSGKLGEFSDVVISAGEHSSVVNTVSCVTGGDYRIIPMYSNGSLDLEWASKLITEDTSLVSVMLANNITGSIFKVLDIVDMAHKKGVPVHCDAVQAYGKMPIDVKELGVDLLSISGHKAHAMSGVGALYIREGFKLEPLITGGGQEQGFRSGTENYIGITTLGVAAEEIMEGNLDKVKGLRDAFETGIKQRIKGVTIVAEGTDRVPNTSAVCFEGIDALSMVLALEETGILASAGPACSSGYLLPDKMLLSMGLTEKQATSTVRFSFSKLSGMIDVALAIEAAFRCTGALREGSGF